jgi:hypothetical protein
MARVALQPVEDLVWDFSFPKQNGGQPGRCYHHMGTEITPQLFEIILTPGFEVGPHAHEANEIIYILEGELHVGPTVLRPGSSAMVPGEALYAFVAGPEGVRFLNFRPCRVEGQLSVEEVKAREKARRVQA